MWNVGADGAGVSGVTTGCSGGLTDVLGDHLGLALGGEVATTLENRARSPMEMQEPGGGLAVGMGEQTRTMTQRFLEAK
jgi:hypothetical protein